MSTSTAPPHHAKSAWRGPRSAALASGVLLALSFPKFGHGAVAFVALVPLFVALSGWNGRPGHYPGVTTRRGFALGLIAGFIHFAGTVYWTGATVQTFGGLPWPVAVFVAGLLALYMATFIGGVGAVTALFIRSFGLPGLLLAPLVWVALEYLRGHLFGGFPWIPLGNTMITLLPVAQLASLLGVYGLSLFVGLVNAGFAAVALASGRTRLMAAAATLVMIAAVSVWGGQRLAANALVAGGTPIRVGLIQANIAQVDKWNPAREGMIVERYLQLTRQAAEAGAEFLLWPESAVPFEFDEDPKAEVIRALVRAAGKPLLLGSDEFETGAAGQSYNSAFMLDSGGATAAVYRKIHLVPFGEYVPFQQVLFFVGPLVEAVSAFTAGTVVTMLPVNGHMASTAICYEVTYPELSREAVRNGSELLTTITNDAWYGESSAAYQHFEMAAMRAVEQGRYLVRAANTGISGIVDPYGRVLIRTRLFETAAVVGEARFVQEKTLYARIGDLVAFVSAALTVFVLAVALMRRTRSGGSLDRI
ncbi:MAG: apolipoprotein N-acyltransferase [Acidobacteriota bacterium]|nr:apolipoprotein N-acyltransferase [Acidobacteriota bacterium]